MPAVLIIELDGLEAGLEEDKQRRIAIAEIMAPERVRQARPELARRSSGKRVSRRLGSGKTPGSLW
jgi:hypothetical protein